MISKKIPAQKTEDRLLRQTPHVPSYFREQVDSGLFPETGMEAYDAYRIIHDLLSLDGNIQMDLGSFTSTWMDPNAEKLIMETLGKNYIDQFEYQQTKDIQDNIVNMLCRLYNAPEESHYAGTCTIGSSEAIELGLLAHKWLWRQTRSGQNKPCDNPNVVFCTDAHVCWRKFARYFDVEERRIPIKSPLEYPLEEILNSVDENTICVGTVMGTTYTGSLDPVAALNDRLIEINQANGWDVGIHVDAASGGFILPFIKPHLEWDFRLKLVRTINVSGHKFGLVYPGLGWLLFKEEKYLPEDLIFKVDYLGEQMGTYTLNFSRGSAMILAQYFNILKYGKEGYTQVMEHCRDNANRLSKYLNDSGWFEVISDLQLPIVTFRFSQNPPFTPRDLSHRLRERNWMLPAYELPEDLQNQFVLRTVVRESFNSHMVDRLWSDIQDVYQKMSTS